MSKVYLSFGKSMCLSVSPRCVCHPDGVCLLVSINCVFEYVSAPKNVMFAALKVVLPF